MRVSAVTHEKSVTLLNDLSVTNSELTAETVTDRNKSNVTKKQSATTQASDIYEDIAAGNGYSDISGSAREHVTISPGAERF